MDRYERAEAIQNLDAINPEFREIDWQIIDILEEGPHTRQTLANRLEVTGEYIYKRVDKLKTIGLVEVLHEGFYALPDHRAIALTDETWDRLNERKEPDESFDALLTRLLAIEPETLERLAQHKEPDESRDAFVNRLLDED